MKSKAIRGEARRWSYLLKDCEEDAMSMSRRIQDYLFSHEVNYVSFDHEQAFPAREVARTLHVSGEDFAKAVVLHSDGRLLMAVLPASCRLDLHKLKEAVGAKHLELAPESELAKLCGDCELGAFPPFGNLYGMATVVDHSLSWSENIVFNAGTHTDAIRMKYSDYAKLVKPRIARFSERPVSCGVG
jgi:Ala-tRNA(Pro) deacylase